MNNQRGFGFLHIVGLLFLGLVATIGYQKYQAHAALKAAQRAEAVRVERLSRELRMLNDLSRELADAAQLAGATSRIAMATPVARLQDIHRKIQDAVVSDCAQMAKGPLDMQALFLSQAFIGFMSNVDGSGEFVAAKLIERAADQKSKFNAAVAVCNESIQGSKQTGQGAKS